MRKAFLMEVKPGMIGEYERRHNPIWPELQEALTSHGVSNYSIFYDKATNQLFGYVEIEDEEKFGGLADETICHKWWLEMTKYLVSENEADPKAKEEELREVFHID